MNLAKNITRARELLHELKLRRLRTVTAGDFAGKVVRCGSCDSGFELTPDEAFRTDTCDRCIALEAHACVEEIVDLVVTGGAREDRPAVKRRNRR